MTTQDWSDDSPETPTPRDKDPDSCPRRLQGGAHEELSRRLAHRSDRIVNLILHSDLPWIDIALEIEQMRWLVEEEAPECMEMFERIYASRFERIREQWGKTEDRPEYDRNND